VKPFKTLEVARGDEFLTHEHFASPENFRRALVRSGKLLLALAHSDEGQKWSSDYRRWTIAVAHAKLEMLRPERWWPERMAALQAEVATLSAEVVALKAANDRLLAMAFMHNETIARLATRVRLDAPEPLPEGLVTMKQAAPLSGYSVSWVQQNAAKGKIKRVCKGGHVLIDKADLLAFAASRSVPQSKPKGHQPTGS
jgi:hypothetical protein